MHPLMHLTLCITTTAVAAFALVEAERPLTDRNTEPQAAKTYRLVLLLSERELDPARPKGNLKCVIRNETSEPVEVPVGYDGEQVQLRSGLLWLHPAHSDRDDGSPKRKPRVKTVLLRPGEEQVVFELPLAQILRLEEQAAKEWRWNWPRRPEPPRSPIHRWRRPGFNPQAVFQARMMVGGKVAQSDMAVLQVKESDPSR